eukprot:Nitzschia sp. Nitz4//scaffold147_size54853//38766//39835//NITZ4_006624-RA/size54853-augustus-gene-0.2-mRNA-1//1//CDS//3329536714//399//frame0
MGPRFVLLLLFVVSANAFLPPVVMTPARAAMSSSSFSENRSPMVQPQRLSSASASTQLHMNMISRFGKVVMSNVNNWIRMLEDPEKIMSQAVEDMQSDLVQLRQSYAEVTASNRRFLKQKESSEKLANEWHQRAQLALQQNNEELARQALSRRQTQLEEIQRIDTQIQAQTEAMDQLYQGMQQLERKILESRAKKEQLAARARTAESTQKVNEMLGGITGKTSVDAFSRMEQKVEAMEAKAEVSAEMGSTYGTILPGSAASTTDAEFRKLEAKSTVDQELEKLKRELSPRRSTIPITTSNIVSDDSLGRYKRDGPSSRS